MHEFHISSHHANCTNKKIIFSRSYLGYLFLLLFIYSLTSIELTPIFLTLLKMTEGSRNVDIIFLHIFYKKNSTHFFAHFFTHLFYKF